MSSKAHDTAELAVRLAHASPVKHNMRLRVVTGHNAYQCARDAVKLMRLAASLNALEVRGCNTPGGLTVKEAKRAGQLRVAIRETIASYGLKSGWRTDDRGFAVHIHFPDGAHNTMGGKEAGWAI